MIIPQVVNQLIQESMNEDERDVEDYQMFSLVRNYDQETLDEPSTKPPVQDFTTSFEGKEMLYRSRIICEEKLN